MAFAGDEGEAAKKARELSKEQLKKFNDAIIIQPRTRKIEENLYVINSSDVDSVLNQIITEDGEHVLPPSLYKNVNPLEEFGVAGSLLTEWLDWVACYTMPILGNISDRDYGDSVR